MRNQIFTNKTWDELSMQGEILHCGYYHRYRNPDGSLNPEFHSDKVSGYILDVKEKKMRGMSYFYEQLRDEICEGVSICVVPSHTAGSINDSGLADIARWLAQEGRIDRVDYLLRTQTVSKLATGGSRELSVHLNSISVNPDMQIKGEVILLVDDVTTSGNSLLACQQILLENGAIRVGLLALGKSI